jgi:hypothetical protein
MLSACLPEDVLLSRIGYRLTKMVFYVRSSPVVESGSTDLSVRV